MPSYQMCYETHLPCERFSTLSTGPEVDSVVQLSKLCLAMDISPGVDRALVGEAETRLELSDYWHPSLEHFWLQDIPPPPLGYLMYQPSCNSRLLCITMS